jgi:L-ascorbate metabolism protein UlaG (beta-lactamase superfamily)
MQKFIKPYGITLPPIKKVFKWKFKSLFQKKRAWVKDDDFKLTVHSLTASDLEREDDFIIWLGHATFYIQLDGVKILTDPVFGDIPLTPRLAEFPIDGSALNPDIILLSHGHYDHLDMKSLEALEVYTKQTKIVMPLNLSSYFKKPINSTELDWYESYEDSDIHIEAVPASHWHRRGIFDFNRALWCSFVIKGKNKTLFFAGDTAMDGHFEEIAQKVDPIDIALMPIGAYDPREIMKDNHMNPQEALVAAEVLGVKQMIPYHYATFKLTAEPIGEPYSWMMQLAKETEIDVCILEVGDVSILGGSQRL